MKKLFSYSLFAIILTFVACDSQEEIQPVLEDEAGIRLLGCYITQTNPDDGYCSGVYHLTAPPSSSYSWSVSGDAYIAVNTNPQQQSISVIPQRKLWTSGSFTVSLLTNGVNSCSKDFTVIAEYLCE
ncbi:hypothetical protein [Ekhidna sp.]